MSTSSIFGTVPYASVPNPHPQGDSMTFRQDCSMWKSRSTVDGRRTAVPGACLILAAMLAVAAVHGTTNQKAEAPSAVSKEASDRCAEKVKTLQEFAEKPEPRPKQTTRISELEINSYLAL